MADPISVLTIVRGRRAHLERLLTGLARSHRRPAECHVVYMNQEPPAGLPDPGCPLHFSTLYDADHPLPLARARNQAARLAQYDRLCFLDVDCIPHPDYLTYLNAPELDSDSLVMGDVHYLPDTPLATNWTFAELEQLAQPHPRRPPVALGKQLACDRYELFWSLSFGLSKKTFERIGGFDTSFRGYGGEDTDFAFAARRADVPFFLVGARAYHQYHPVSSPPLQHLADLVINARVFKAKWGVWPMEGWLGAFAERGYVEWDPRGEHLRLISMPDAQAIARSRSTDPFA